MPIRPQPASKSVSSEKLVKTVLQIMEQGPQPMRDMRPSKKNPNGADQFRTDHQGDYESYESQGCKDRSRRVDCHNAAFPKMIDELEKRRSTARALAPGITDKRRSANQTTYFDPHCRLCQKLKMAGEIKKRTPKAKPRNDNRKRKADKKSRVSKPKRAQRNVRSTFKLSKLRRNKGIQYRAGTVQNDAGTTPGTDDQGMSEIYFSSRSERKSRSSQAGMTNPSMSQNGSKSDVISHNSQNPDTSANSLTSYNSNMSLDQEPMVPR